MVSEAEASEAHPVEPTPAAPAPAGQPRASGGAGRAVLSALAKVAAGLVVGCAIAEAAFHYRDRGAFPHLNVYVADAELGVRLRPGATERVVAGRNPITSVRINAQGFRGADWPPPGDDEVLVVGDSQAFGLGVEENETASAVLATLLPGKTVLNAGVPTYGPGEYARVVAETFEKRHPKAVVVIVNFANDLFEAGHPNKGRHAEWDGWAVRRETAPEHVTSFPGRELLFQKSHAFFAARAFWYAHGPRYDDRAFSSKRTFRDVALAGLAAEDEKARAAVESARAVKKHDADVRAARAQADKAQAEVDGLIADKVRGNTASSAYRAAIANPGDIVGYTSYEEWDEPVYATAELIRQGAVYRKQLEEKLREHGRADPALAGEVDKTFAAREATGARYAKMTSEPAPTVRAWSPVAPALREIEAVADAHGARVFVVALPLDVQISPDEWAKYGDTPIDMTPADVLVGDVLDAALALGATPVDTTAALRAAEPGAFLHADIHLTPKGQRALAERVAAAMAAPPPVPIPGKGLPAGRSKVPAPHAWAGLREVNLHGSTAAECATHLIREWLRVDCKKRRPTSPRPLGVQVVEGGHGEAFVTAGEDEVVLVVPVVAGDRFLADFSWSDRTQRLAVQWPDGAPFPEMIFQKPSKDAPSPFPPALALEPLCGCAQAHDATLTCLGELLAPSPDCARTFPGACDKILACAEGDPETPPSCPSGQANAGATNRCFVLCGPGRPCAAGVCSPWQGGQVCM